MSGDVRIIMGVDPGLASTGFGIISVCGNKFQHIKHGVIETDVEVSQEHRLLTIYDELKKVIKKYKPTEAGIETLRFAKNVTSALSVSEARGVALLLFAQNDISLAEFSPNTIKKTVAGVATADKKQVQFCVKLLLGLKEIPEPDHAADALAAAITKVHLSDVLNKEVFYV